MPSFPHPVLLLISDHPTVREEAVWLRGQVVRVPHVGGARDWLADPGRYADGVLRMVAWGPDVVGRAEEHWRLAGLDGVVQVGLRLLGQELGRVGVVALGLERLHLLPGAVELLNEELWPLSEPSTT